MNDSEFYDFEDRRYINPTLSRDEQLEFVNTLRDTVDRNTAQVNTQTQKLGTDMSPNLGGLSGSSNYFKQRYQTTPVQSQVATLKATAQAKALNDLMTNYQSQAANRYQQAYRTAATSGGNNGGNTGGGGGDDGDDDDKLPDNVTTNVTDNKTQAQVGESDVVLPESHSEGYDLGETPIGSSPLPRRQQSTSYYYTLNGENTAFTVEKTALGSGISTPTRDYGTRDAAINFIKDIKSRGARIYNAWGKDITDMALYAMGL